MGWASVRRLESVAIAGGSSASAAAAGCSEPASPVAAEAVRRKRRRVGIGLLSHAGGHGSRLAKLWQTVLNSRSPISDPGSPISRKRKRGVTRGILIHWVAGAIGQL